MATDVKWADGNAVIADSVQRWADGDIYDYWYISAAYSRGAYLALPGDDTDLDTLYSTQDYEDVDTINGTRVVVEASDGDYAIHQFKDYVQGHNSCTVRLVGQSSQPPSDSTLILQVYNHNTDEWDNLDSDNVSDADTNFTLEAYLPSLSDYSNLGILSCRVYQKD